MPARAAVGRAIRVLVDGIPSAVIDVADRGLQYGHGVFETCRVIEGRVPLWAYHRARLADSAMRLAIALDVATLDAEVQDAIADQSAALLKIIVTAGRGDRGYRSGAGRARRIISVSPPPRVRDDAGTGVTVRICRTRLAIQPAFAGLKHLNRLEQVCAAAEWSDPAIADGLMCDTNDCLVEGTTTNLFLVIDDRIVTPAVDRCGVAGVMRRVLLEARPGISVPIDVRDVTLRELGRADECFLTNAVIGVWPVAHVLGHGDIGARPGRIAHDIRAALEARFGFVASH